MVNVGVTAYNIDNLGIKAFLKTTGKQTAKAMVKGPNKDKAGAEGKETEKENNQEKTNGMEEQKPEEEKKK